jgi:dephospho-CoA kinase
MKAIVCISGEIASGKTTIARALAEHFRDVTVRSFGDVVREQALSEGKLLDRATLQEVGLSLVAAGWPSFVDALLEGLPPSIELLVVEGIRHREAVDEIARRNLSDKLLIVYLQVDPQVQAARQQDRGESFRSRTHTVEFSLSEVQAMADLVVDGSLSVGEIVEAAIQCL